MHTPFLQVLLSGARKLIAVDSVREILPMMQLHEEPAQASPDGFRGFANVRGNLVPVFLDAQVARLSPDSFIIIFERDERPWGRVVDDVQDIVHISESQISDANPGHRGRMRAARLDEQVIGILDPAVHSEHE